MKIGLYSEIGRQHILKIRNEIKSMKIGTSKIEIKNFRQYIAESNKEDHKQFQEKHCWQKINLWNNQKTI